jgi:hypothetical protein
MSDGIPEIYDMNDVINYLHPILECLHRLTANKKFEYKLMHPVTMAEKAVQKAKEQKAKGKPEPYGTAEFFNEMGAEGWQLRGEFKEFMIFIREIE